MNTFLQMMRNLGPMRLAAIAGVGVSVLGFLVFLMSRVAAPQLDLLYGELDLNDSKAIIEKLAADQVPYEVRKDGTEIWVPKDVRDDLRVKMAEQAMPTSGRLPGYELLDKQDALSTTSFQQNVNYLRALEGELARTIRSIDGVQTARVHLVLPKREAFSREAAEPSASVVLKMKGTQRLNKSQAQSIQHLIAAAVPKMKPSRISIVDDKGTLLARGFENAQDQLVENAEEIRLGMETRLVRVLEEMLERTLGPGRVRAEVSVEMDLSRATTTEDVYDPEGQVVRSQVTVTENEQSSEGEPPPVTVEQNLPDPQVNAANTRAQSKSNRTQETINYEITRRTKNVVREIGEVRRITAAVLVDGVYEEVKAADGTVSKVYRDRSPEELAKLDELVKNAIGYDRSRDDQVKVVSLRFAGGEEQYATDEPSDYIFGMRREFVEKIASNLGLSIVAILFLLLVLRPLIGRAVEGMQPQTGPDGRRLAAGPAGVPQLAAPGGAPPPVALAEEEIIADELIDIDKVEGRVKSSSLRKIGEIVDKHPEEALSIIRNWLYQSDTVSG